MYFAYLGSTVAAKVEPTISTYGTGDNNTGNVIVTYDVGTGNKAGGFIVRNYGTTAPDEGVVAKITFKVVAGAEGGEDLPIKLNNSYTFDGTNYTSAESKFTVTVLAGCEHANKVALDDAGLAEAGKTNVEATCLVVGETWYYCPDCEQYTEVISNTLDHVYTEERVIDEPTCLGKGSKALFCVLDPNCTAHGDTSEIDPLGHDFTSDNYVYVEPTCEEDGYEIFWCPRCNRISVTENGTAVTGNKYYIDGKFYNNTNASKVEIDIPEEVKLLALGHDWVVDRTEGDTVYYVCTRADKCGVAEKAVSASDTVRYVAENGTGDGLSAENPTTLEAAYDAFHGLPEDVECTIYICGKVTLPNRQVSSANTVAKSFEETQHDATVTITTAPGMSKGEIHFPFETTSMFFLYGPTVFDNVKISSSATGTTSGSSASINIYARGFEVTMTENFETVGQGNIAYSKSGGNCVGAVDITMNIPDCKLYLLGGFYPNGGYDGANTSTFEVNMNIYGGTYWVVVGASRANMATQDSVINMYIGGKAKIGQLIPVTTTDGSNVSGTVVNMHYMSSFEAVLIYRAHTAKSVGHYTVNHFFHRGSGNIKFGDFMMGDKTCAKTVNVYYNEFDSVAATLAKNVDAKGKNYQVEYQEEQEYMPFVEWCVVHGGGHDYDDGVCSFCEIEKCEEHKTETIVESLPTCQVDGVSYERCTVCFEQVGETVIVPLDPDAHALAWDTDADVLACVCTNEDCDYVYATYESEVKNLYVSDNGVTNGGFSADYPINDFETAFQIAAAAENDVTIYIVGKVTINPNFEGSTHTVFAEYPHENKITICGYKNQGIFSMPGLTSTGKTIYAMNGDTTFENIEFSNWNTKASSGYFYLAAQHNKLVLGENITIDYQRNQSSAYNSCSPLIIGGCYHSRYTSPTTSVKVASCSGAESNVTFYSGSYYEFLGGSVGGACGGGNMTVNVTVRGDVSFRDYFVLGGFEQDVGDINFTLDGTVSAGAYFSLTGVNKTADLGAGAAKNVTLKIYDGTILSQNFETVSGATTVRPLGATLRPDNGVYDITRNLETLTIFYDPSIAAAKATAMRFNDSNHTKSISYKIIDETFCTANADGKHTVAETIEEVSSTCALQGYGIYKCADCGKKYTEAFAVVPHTFGEAVKAKDANCVDPQIDKKTCECGFIEYVASTEVLATGEHAYDEETGICVHCNLNKQDLCEHMWSDPTVAYSGCGKGTKTVCTLCDKVVIDITSADHAYSAFTVTVEPTATEPGVKTRYCKHCGKVDTALIYAGGGSVSYSAFATDANGSLANLVVDSYKLSKKDREALNVLLQSTAYGSEVKVSYDVEGDVITNITYRIPLPAEYKDMENVKVVVKDDSGAIHTVEFTVEQGYIVFTY